MFQYAFTSIIIPTTEFSFPVLEASFFFILSSILTFTSRTEQVVLSPPPPSKNRLFRKKHQNRVFIIERCSKVSSYNFLKKDQILADF